jgi:hypothetical protein
VSAATKEKNGMTPREPLDLNEVTIIEELEEKVTPGSVVSILD